MRDDNVRGILAGNLKRYRGRRQWSQADLAEKTGLSIVYLSDIERGNKWPYLDTLVKLADAFEIEIFELLKPPEAGIPAGAVSLVVQWTDETSAIVEKSLDTLKKTTLQSLMNLRDHYLESRR